MKDIKRNITTCRILNMYVRPWVQYLALCTHIHPHIPEANTLNYVYTLKSEYIFVYLQKYMYKHQNKNLIPNTIYKNTRKVKITKTDKIRQGTWYK